MTTKKKSLGLAAFGAKGAKSDAITPQRNDATASASDKKKAAGGTVANTVRLPRNAWLKIQHLALDEGTSFQALAVAGLDNELKRRGLPGLYD